MGTKIGLTGITFGDATVQNTAATTGVTSLVAGTGISVSGATGAVTVSATGGGTVTSVATGNGLSGGTITSTGTLTVACPSFNSVGSYCMASIDNGASGTNYAAGSGGNNMKSGSIEGSFATGSSTNNLSGTWKWMAAPISSGNGTYGMACRVS
jgi:hypothetical protein